METQTQTQEQMLAEILEQTRATKKYMKWQLIITVALVVLPIIGLVIIIPIVMSSLASVYGTNGIMQNLGGLQ